MVNYIYNHVNVGNGHFSPRTFAFNKKGRIFAQLNLYSVIRLLTLSVIWRLKFKDFSKSTLFKEKFVHLILYILVTIKLQFTKNLLQLYLRIVIAYFLILKTCPAFLE